MKELVVISGKGGTGKTSIVASFAALAQNKVMVDCDVDAADLHLILKPEIEETIEFYSGKQAEIIQESCKHCGKCIEVCRFNAINRHTEPDSVSHKPRNFSKNDLYVIDEIKCEGCGACYFNCPYNAIRFEQAKSGDWFKSNTRFGKLIHATLGIAEENSGKLVSEIRNHARLAAKQNNNELIITDGSPGIGCPVIASISGADLVLIVTEPTLSGIHDAQRVYELTQHFKIPACMCINKFDLNLELTVKIEEFCRERNIELSGKIPYSNEFTEAMIREKSVVEYSDSEVSVRIKQVWDHLYNRLMNKENVKMQ